MVEKNCQMDCPTARQRITFHFLGVFVAVSGASIYLMIMGSWVFLAYITCCDSSPESPAYWWAFRHAIAAPLLFGIFFMAILKRKKTRLFASLLISAFVIMICWSIYDCYEENYQIDTHSGKYGWENYHVLGKGARHYYVNWPWLTELGPYLPQKERRPEDPNATTVP